MGLLSTGLLLWLLGDGSAHSVLLGKALCGVSVLPFGMMALRWVEDCRFAARQKELDGQQYAVSSPLSLSSPSSMRMATAVVATSSAVPISGRNGCSTSTSTSTSTSAVIEYELIRRDDKV